MLFGAGMILFIPVLKKEWMACCRQYIFSGDKCGFWHLAFSTHSFCFGSGTSCLIMPYAE